MAAGQPGLNGQHHRCRAVKELLRRDRELVQNQHLPTVASRVQEQQRIPEALQYPLAVSLHLAAYI